jgi:hypothetical protein
MTCIAYRAGVLASDTQAEIDDVIKLDQEVKVAKRKGHLFGIAGDDLPKLSEVIKNYFSKEHKPMKGFKFDCMVIKPDGTIEVWDERMKGEPYKLEFYALGNAAPAAMTAMEVGATAEQAVRACIKWVPHVGGKVVVRKL